ncbi:MAG: hypothetical protein IPP94_18925 [Ignavibacteria bacterium]|nr:hypothetical protein [Ignavibacteria bacterium]
MRDWQGASAGRLVYAGMAPYKDNVRAGLAEMIDATRAQGARGELYFRYEHIADGAPFMDRYAAPAIPPSLPWRDAIRPNPPTRLAVAFNEGAATVSWTPPAPALDGDRAWKFAVYRDGALAAVLPGIGASFVDSRPGASYSVTALDRLHNESEPATSLAAAASTRLPAPSIAASAPRVSDAVDVSDKLVLIAYEVPVATVVRLRLLDLNDAEAAILVDGMHAPGSYVIGIELDRLSGPIGSYVFEAGEYRAVRPF